MRSGLVSAVFASFLWLEGESLKPAVHEHRETVDFIFLGDWGCVNDDQARVASEMERVAKEKGVDFVVMGGDNFYETGVSNLKDPQFRKTFEKVYNKPALSELSFKAVLGNHDWLGNATSQLDYVDYKGKGVETPLKWEMPNLWYSEVHTVPPKDSDSEAEGLIVLAVYFDSWLWGSSVMHKAQERQRNFVKKSLKAAADKADWIVLLTHYPMYSSGHHGDTKVLKKELLPVVDETGVDLYVNGHDHDLELIRKKEDGDKHATTYVTSGSGCKTRTFTDTHKHSLWKAPSFGFSIHTFNGDSLETKFLNSTGGELFTFSQKKRKRNEGNVAVQEQAEKGHTGTTSAWPARSPSASSVPLRTSSFVSLAASSRSFFSSSSPTSAFDRRLQSLLAEVPEFEREEITFMMPRFIRWLVDVWESDQRPLLIFAVSALLLAIVAGVVGIVVWCWRRRKMQGLQRVSSDSRRSTSGRAPPGGEEERELPSPGAVEADRKIDFTFGSPEASNDAGEQGTLMQERTSR